MVFLRAAFATNWANSLWLHDAVDSCTAVGLTFTSYEMFFAADGLQVRHER
ncbi:hypothetical protein ACIQZB_38395 [Streptomyces sp. NPDC097727]|uniref:hypothetical protein n=1 Tax=Streptomyces sp. NPDC097727 TaxID=3366092 RepID=UPI003812053F